MNSTVSSVFSTADSVVKGNLDGGIVVKLVPVHDIWAVTGGVGSGPPEQGGVQLSFTVTADA